MQTFEIHGRDEYGNWSAENISRDVILFDSRTAAESAVAELVRTLDWPADDLRVVEFELN
jgi:hypothetical protein